MSDTISIYGHFFFVYVNNKVCRAKKKYATLEFSTKAEIYHPQYDTRFLICQFSGPSDCDTHGFGSASVKTPKN